MLELYIGGYAQGKLEYVREKLSHQLCVIDCACEDVFLQNVPEGQVPVLYHFHSYIRNMVFQGTVSEEVMRILLVKLFMRFPDCIIISDEVGNGIVPLNRDEREYREVLGRALIEIAKKADRVERIVCGLGERIK